MALPKAVTETQEIKHKKCSSKRVAERRHDRVSSATVNTTIKPLALDSHEMTEKFTCGNAVSKSVECNLVKVDVSAKISV